MAFQFSSGVAAFAIVLGCACCLGQPAPQVPIRGNGPSPTEISATSERLPGSISGTVMDPSGAVVAGARVRLSGGARFQGQEALSGTDGQFSFANVAPGPFQLSVTAPGFATQTSSGNLLSGENYIVPGSSLAVASTVTDVEVGVTRIEVAEDQMKVEEQQRVFGVLPNFYVSYVPDAAPLDAKLKFKLAARTVVDPFTIVFVAGAAGVEQAQNHFEGYGQGAQGYAKRFGAGYADTVAGTFIGGAILPSLLKQDPRYFYKGTGSKASRFLYAIAASVICKGDNGRWQPNYSNVLGNFAAGGISNLYYPPQDRDGAGLTLENGAIGIGATAVANIFQEFIIRKLTPKAPNN
jgi:Carboxypeptidase regulatory-like domain